MNLRYMIETGNFLVHQLLTTEHFIRYCKERDIEVTHGHLERYERLGIFMPLARAHYPMVKVKIARNEEGTDYIKIGVLEEGEEWSGKVEERRAHLYWFEGHPREWIEEGLLWEPTVEGFQPWSTFKDEQGDVIVDTFYSTFQTLPLQEMMRSTALPRFGLDQLIEMNPEEVSAWTSRWVKGGNRIIDKHCDGRGARDEAAILCQVIATRYYPHIQADKGKVVVPHEDFFDWEEYRRAWNARKVLDDLDLTDDKVRNLAQMVAMEARLLDPLEHWSELVNFVTHEKRKKLKGSALLAQTWHGMERMLNMFLKDLTGSQVYLFGRSPSERESLYGQGVPQDDLRYLEYLTNEFGINPRPRLMLAVEGVGEHEQFPRLMKDMLGLTPSGLRIGLIPLSGVTGFTGSKKDRYGALEKLIDYFHYMQTIVFVILDDEDRVAAVKQRLVTAKSKLHPRRTVTKDEYIHLWKKNVEFDNFTHAEIARAMSEVSQGRHDFTEAEIADCDERFGRRGDPLSRLYETKCVYELPKPELLKVLCDAAVVRPKMMVGDTEMNRPIVDVLDKVIGLAIHNYPPSYFDAWEETQNSDWLGTPALGGL